MKKRLSKVLAAAGVASRRACEEIIFQKRVKVNGQLALAPFTMVDEEHDKITVDDSLVKVMQKKVYFVLNKPDGYVCTTLRTSPRRKLVLDLFSHLPFRLFTVGRLDKETTGLLLITNDGAFANQIMHPSFGVEKEYLAKTDQEITDDHLKDIAAGCWVEGSYVRPVSIKKVRRGTVKVTVVDGKKREVRQLLAHVGLEVKELCRIRLGSLTLGGLPLGGYRELTSEEIVSLTKNSVKRH